MTIVIVQSRLGSTRLPEKGLLPVGGKPAIAHVLDTMRHVPADAYYLATDEASYERLAPVAADCGWECFAGPAEDVLERFCLLIEKTHADVVVRATGDNPFLFADAASASLEEFLSRIEKGNPCDYFTYTGLPHGSGIEVMNAASLLDTRRLTKSPYDHEHVGPALYNHDDYWKCVFEPAPEKWNHPELRTTIDTFGDYRRALRMFEAMKENGPACGCDPAARTAAIIEAANLPYIKNPVLFVPSTEAGHGTGHLRRCLSLAKELNADIYIPEDATLAEAEPLLAETGLDSLQVIRTLPVPSEAEPRSMYSLVVADMFSLKDTFAKKLRALGPLAAIDEGSSFTDCCDYLLDIIPAVQYTRRPNFQNAQFIPLPEHRKTAPVTECKTALVSIGGEDPKGFTAVAKAACEALGLAVTAVTAEAPVQNLKEKLADYDLVVTHYGFTAFEARAAGCRVLTLATTPLHQKLSEAQGFACIPAKELSSAKRASSAFSRALVECGGNEGFRQTESGSHENADLASYLRDLASGHRNFCPVCRENAADPVVARTQYKTYRKCPVCGMTYLSWSRKPVSDYSKAYFFEEYKNQYGKTYLEDFDLIKKQGERRMAEICALYDDKKKLPKKVLDIGCAYGPFLAAAAQSGWRCYGTDISEDAVTYVRDNLGFHAVTAAYPALDADELDSHAFGAVTMWYVIEHFEDLDAVLAKTAELIPEGGVFAFGTPAGHGVSSTYCPDKFFEQSPSDHYSIWDEKTCGKILAKYGFRVVKTVSTGHHAERFPLKKQAAAGSFRYRLLTVFSRMRHLGDTFEVYCVKTR
ncbi:MAG: methyltransferase domain-containing protein [Treponema sp.]|nr:methyltransferase domain-containing protein [Candidatus Treponema caballi]